MKLRLRIPRILLEFTMTLTSDFSINFVRNRSGYKTLTKSRLKRTSNGVATYTQVESEAHWRQVLEKEFAVVLTERRAYEGATATSRLGDGCASARL